MFIFVIFVVEVVVGGLCFIQLKIDVIVTVCATKSLKSVNLDPI